MDPCLVSALRQRLERLQRHLEEHDLTAAAVGRPEHVRYLTGLGLGPRSPGVLLVTRSERILVAPAGGAPDPTLVAIDVAVESYTAYDASVLVDRARAAIDRLATAARRAGLRGRVAIEPDYLPAGVARALGDVTAVDLSPALSAWRRAKDAYEREALGMRAAMLDRAFDAAHRALRPGLSELDLFTVLHGSLLADVEEPLLLASNLGAGPRAALADPHPTGRRIEAGDLVLVDLYPVLDGYAADCTRTFVVGEPTRLQQERHDVLVRALHGAEALLRSGVEVGRVDARIREVLADAGGYDRTMQHHGGHGIGLLAWEAPWLGPRAEGHLRAGDVIALEPGLYLPDWGGMRVEGNYAITEDGFERLDAFPTELIVADV